MKTIRHKGKTKPQREFWNSDAKNRLLVGGVGSGKTRAGIVEVMKQPAGSTGMVLAPTYPMLRDATLRTFLDLTRRADILEEFNKGEMRAVLTGRRTVLFRSADNPDRLRGPIIGWFYLDEAAMMGRETWLIMIGRLREAPGRAWATTTPRGKNWLYREFLNKPATHHVVRASSRTNPFLPPDFVQSLVDTYDDYFARQEVEGEFLDDSHGLLFPGFWVDRVGAVRRPDGLTSGGRRMGVDLGEGVGRDRTVIFVTDDLGILHGEESDRMGIAAAAQRVDEVMREWGVRQDHVVYDAGGRGKDFPRYLEPYRITEAVPYHGGGAGGAFAENKRSKMGWKLRQRLDPDRPVIPPPPDDYEDHELTAWEKMDRASIKAEPPAPQPAFSLPADRAWWPILSEELKQLKYTVRGRKVALEKKDDLAKRLGRSPDLVDGLLMTFAAGDDG